MLKRTDRKKRKKQDETLLTEAKKQLARVKSLIPNMYYTEVKAEDNLIEHTQDIIMKVNSLQKEIEDTINLLAQRSGVIVQGHIATITLDLNDTDRALDTLELANELVFNQMMNKDTVIQK